MGRRTVAWILLGVLALTAGVVALFLQVHAVAIARGRAERALARGEASEAVAQFRRALARAPERPDLALALATTLVRMNRLAEAEEAVARAGALAPTSREARRLAFELALRAGAPARVAAAAQAVVALDPADRRARRALARALASLSRWAEADQAYRALLAQGSPEPVVFVELAVVRWALGDAAGAETALREALAAAPTGEPRVLLALADHLATSGRPAEAASFYERYLAQAPRDRGARLQLAEALVAAGALDRAVGAYRAALEQEPDDSETRLKLARALSWLKRYPDAVGEYRKLLGDR